MGSVSNLDMDLGETEKKTIQTNPDPTLGHMVGDFSFKDFITVWLEITVWLSEAGNVLIKSKTCHKNHCCDFFFFIVNS